MYLVALMNGRTTVPIKGLRLAFVYIETVFIAKYVHVTI